jgi:hypothetical protein
MANWADIPVKNPGDPARAVDYNQTNENIEALAEGAAGAPRVQTDAIEGSAVTTAKIVSGERMTNANVRIATASSSVGAVGTYAFLGTTTSTLYTAGGTSAGSLLRYAGVRSSGSSVSGTAPAGTWRAMGSTDGTVPSPVTLWLRIS